MLSARYFLLAALLSAPVFPKPLRMPWSGLSQWTGPEHRVRITTQEGSVLIGILRSVLEDRLVLDVRYSSSPIYRTKVETVVERSSIRGLAVRKEKRSARREGLWIGVILGSLAAPMSAQAATSTPQAVAGGLACVALYGALGYAIGRGFDEHWTDVALEDQNAPPQWGPDAQPRVPEFRGFSEAASVATPPEAPPLDAGSRPGNRSWNAGGSLPAGK